MKLIKAFLGGLNKFIAFFIIVAILFCVAIPILNQYAVMELRKSIEKINNERMHFSVKKIDIDVLLQTISFKEVSVSFQDSTIQSNINIEKVAIRNISIYEYLKHGKIEITQAYIFKPRCLIYKSDSPRSISKNSSQPPSLLDLHFYQIVVNDMYLEFHDSTKKNSISTIQSIDFSISNLKINNNSERAKIVPKITAEINYILLKKIKTNKVDERYQLKIDKIICMPLKQILYIDSIEFLPFAKKNIFFKEVGYQTDRFEVHSKSILATFQYKNIFTIFDSIHLLNITVLHPEMVVCRDRNYTRKLTIKSGIQELLRNSKCLFQIDALGIYNGRIQYEEIPKESTVSSKIWFTNLNGRIMNISTNDTNNNLLVNANAFLYGEGKLYASLVFPYANNSNSFNCNGVLRNLNMKKLNPILEENLHIKITEGNIHSMKFNFNADSIKSKGTMQFIYDDLKIAVQNKQSKKTTGMKEKIKSFVANKILLHRSSESKNRDNEIVALYFIKDQTKFIFNYIAKTLLSGIKETLGLNRKNIQKLSKKSQKR